MDNSGAVPNHKICKIIKKIFFNTHKMSNPIENLKGKIKKIVEFEMLENKLNKLHKINKIKIEKIREIMRKRLKELEIRRLIK